MTDVHTRAAFIWSIADLLRGVYKQADYGKVVIPLTLLRRLDCVIEPTRQAVWDEHERVKDHPAADRFLARAARGQIWNTSPHTFKTLVADNANVRTAFEDYLAGFSPAAREIVDRYKFHDELETMDEARRLYRVVSRFADVDLHPNVIPNDEMGYVFEELIRMFAEVSNETAGEHFTPREVIKLKVNLLLGADAEVLSQPGAVRTLYDPAAGTGGMLSVAQDYLADLHPHATLRAFGQELNGQNWAMCRADLVIKGQDPRNVAFGDTLADDKFAEMTFDYMISNPPFGVDWEASRDVVVSEHERLGMDGRFGAGYPRKNDGSLLFLQHMISKSKPVAEGGSRISIVFSGGPLFAGGAESGESEVRRWIIENDWLEAVVALPDQLFYNTSINTYVWLVTNNKSSERRGKVQLIDARGMWERMPKSFGDKRKRMPDVSIRDITRLHADFAENDHSKIVPNEALGYRRITIERPLRIRRIMTAEGLALLEADPAITATLTDAEPGISLSELLGSMVGTDTTDNAAFEARLGAALAPLGKLPAVAKKTIAAATSVPDDAAPVVTDRRGRAVPDPDARDQENVPLTWDVDDYFKAEVAPHIPGAWIDHSKTKLGFEIPLARLFYCYDPPRSLSEIDDEIRGLEERILVRLREVTTR